MLIFLKLACSAAIVDVHQWKKEVLFDDNWQYFQRSPDALVSKFQQMTVSPFTFLRGNLSIQLGHWSLISEERLGTSFLNTPDSTMVPIFGDPHPENLVVCAHPSQPISVEITDLDAASYAPWIIDVRRALTAQRIFASQMERCEEACQTGVVESWLHGFVFGLKGDAVDVYESQIVLDLAEEALEEGSESKKYHKYTTDGMLDRDEYLNDEGKGIFSISRHDSAPYEIFAAFAKTRNGTARLLDVAQRFGMGISSHAALRYVFVWDEGLDGEEDNQMLLAREVFDPPDYPGRLGIYNGPFETNAHRVSALRRQLWDNPAADPNYTGQSAVFDYKTQTWSSYFQDVEVSKIQEDWTDGRYDEYDLADLAYVMGGMMALKAHQSRVLSGRSSAEVILEDLNIGGGFDVLIQEMVEQSRVDAVQLFHDYEWFVQELRRSGPMLGFDVLGDGR